MSLPEIVSRIQQSNTRAAFIISSYKGNPGNLQVIESNGVIVYELVLESALLRRETRKEDRTRISYLSTVSVHQDSSTNTKEFGSYLAALLDVDFSEIKEISDMQSDLAGRTSIFLQDYDSKVLWTVYHTLDLSEIGPRIRISHIRRFPNEQ
ncbi:MAG: hypothetical protein ACFFED_00885 [Candidatus Thorarchaeota archaeon]